MSILGEADRSAEVRIRAYSFDQPDVIQAALSALGKGAKLWLIADGSQSRGSTKQQLESLKILREAGGQVRLCCGNSVNEAYQEDGRNVKGGQLGGLHRSKALPRVTPSTQCIIGSCNFTSSKANAESWSILAVEPGFHF